jgi:hypothetical protein
VGLKYTAKISRGQIDGERQAKGITQGILKPTCAVLAHLSKKTGNSPPSAGMLQ